MIEKKPLSQRQERLLAKELYRREQLLVSAGVAAVPTEAEIEMARKLYAGMHPDQQKFFFDTDPFSGIPRDPKRRRRVRKTGRRWGKTSGHARKFLIVLLLNPRAVSLYMDISSTDIRIKIWPEFLKLIAENDLPFRALETSLNILHKRSTGRIICRGASDRAKVEKLRGLGIGGNFVLAGIDESATFGASMEKLVASVIGPGLRDAGGELLLTGSPGYYPEGLFYEASSGKLKSWVTYPAATCQDNPFMPAHAKDFDLIIEEEGLSGRDDPIFIREWLGEYCINNRVQMFEFDPHVNCCSSYPANLTFYGSVDFGWTDESAIVVIGYSPQNTQIYAVWSWSAPRQDSDEIADQMREVSRRFTIQRWIGDTGGDGKRTAEQIWRDYGIFIEPAQKSEKLNYVQFMNSAFRRRDLWILAGTGVALELPKVLWNEAKTDASKRAVDNNAMALLYGWRAVKYLAGKSPARESIFTDASERAKQDLFPEDETENKVRPALSGAIDLEDWYIERLSR